MILSRLRDYYYHLLENPDPISGVARVPPYGFTDEKISYCLVLSPLGELVDIQDIRDTTEKKPKPKSISVPRPEKRTSGVKPNFLWDKTAYVLGVEGNKDKKNAKAQPTILSEKTFEAFKDYHLTILAHSNDEGLQAVCKFLTNWNPQNFSQSFKDESIDANVIFKLDGDVEYIHERAEAKKCWSLLLQPSDEEVVSKGMCLVTGQEATLSRLHPAIKGVYSGQSSGGSIVSFNASAYESFGKEQGNNAPVSDEAAFAYTTVLNYLLRRENKQCILIGDTSTVFWALANNEQQTQEAINWFNLSLNTANDETELKEVRLTLEKISQGRPVKDVVPKLDEDTRFFILGLAPNAARLSIRYWQDTTIGALGKNLEQHWNDVQINPPAWKNDEPPSMWRWLIQIAAQDKSENIPPQLAGEFLRSIITGYRYPRMLLTFVVQRIRADGKISPLRVALVKAVICRDYRLKFIDEGVPMAFTLENVPPAYRLGCLFAVLERIQEAALGKDINATITDRYYGTASSVPYSVFPRLIKSAQHHLSKVRKDKPGFAVNLNKDLAKVIELIPVDIPKHLSIEDQGRFAVGYYHQRQYYFTKKDDANSSNEIDENV